MYGFISRLCASPSVFKTERVSCNYSRKTVSRVTKNLSTHLTNCKLVPRSLVRLQQLRNKLGDGNLSVTTNHLSRPYSGSKCLDGPLSYLNSERLSSQDAKELEVSFEHAVHSTETPFAFFNHAVSEIFFNQLRPLWIPPHPKSLGGKLLDEAYTVTMKLYFPFHLHVCRWNNQYIWATNVLNKSLSKDI